MRLSLPGVWSPGDSRAGAVRPTARGRGCGRACRRRGAWARARPSARPHRPTPSSSTCRARSRAARSSSPAGSYQYRDLVAVHVLHRGLGAQRRARLRPQRPHGRHAAGRPGHGRVAIASRTYADGREAPATGSFGGSVSDLVVAGAAVSVAPGGQFAIPGIGWGAVDERRIVRSDGAYRGSEVALHIHLSSDWHNLPAGTEILLGYSDAAADGAHGGADCRRGQERRDALRARCVARARRRGRDESRPARRARRARACQRRHADGLG